MKNKSEIIAFPDLKQAGRRDLKAPAPTRVASSSPSQKLLAWAKGKSYCLQTSGCQANVRDSEILSAYLENLKMRKEEDPLISDLVLFNTCAVRENAEVKIYGELGRLKKSAEDNPEKIIGICGCMAQEEKPMRFIKDNFPYVKLVFGIHNLDSIYTLLDACLTDEKRIFDVPSKQGEIVEGMPSLRFDKYKAFVNIMYGCDNFCTYCIVPYTRGRQRSRKIEDVVAEVNCLKAEGYKEVTLLGQNVNAYGFDLKDGVTSFSNLLEAVAKTGIDRVRFMTSHPAYFTEDVFKVMASYPNIMPALHLPLQSGSDKVLKRMNRHYDQTKYLALVKLLRSYIPDIYLSTDIIVGFPNETEEDFEETLKVCREVGYDNAFTFIYSPRDGTPAAIFPDGVSKEEKSKRFMALKDEIDKEATAAALKEVGKTVEVLFDSVSKKNDEMISGYSRHNRLVHVKSDSSLIGQIRKVKILESHTYSLIGELLDE
ncbi:MAG: tRNA (N6-isopentenyl adenosine(37)-C2)-methylthiotransferase MiaB [Bacilli bacterium]|jgi:tRNA-2-methylthio-N6-dimethylallyladenosine synthase|nr:tRNA (N6-isopentenyl adenosine(37)-C2)-methylthiotransferase MiaB [Bacilli bacterium]